MSRPVDSSSHPRRPTVRGDVAVIGMACTFPGARNLAEFWHNIVSGVDAITDVPRERWDPEVFYDPDPNAEDRVYCKRGGYLGGSFAFNPLRCGTMPRAVEGAEPDQFLVLRAVYEAMQDAGYLERELNGARSAFILGRGSYLGAGLTGLLQRGTMTHQTLEILKTLHPEYTEAQLDEIKKAIRSKLPGFGAETAPGLIPNITTGRVANRLDLKGPTYTVDAACASALIATDLAVRDLLTGQYDLVLVGGVHIFFDVPFLQVFTAMGALSRSGIARPFDKDCDGILPGEGIGIIVLKRLEDAVAHGDRIYAVIKGVGTSSDGKATSVTAPRVEGEELALRRAYEMSGIPPQTVGLIEAHGTGTSIGDSAEVEALHRVFGPGDGGPPVCAVGSVKSMIGHTMPAAGAAGLIKTVLALYHRVLPPTLNCQQPVDALTEDDSRFYVNTETRPWIHGRTDTPRRAGVSAFGFGGVNAHVVLEEYNDVGCLGAPTVHTVPTTFRTAAPTPLPVEPTARAISEQTSVPSQHNEPSTLIRDWPTEVCVVQGDSREALLESIGRMRDYAVAADGVAIRDLAYTLNTSLGGADYRVAVVASSLPDLAEKLGRAADRLSDPQCDQIRDAKGIYYLTESPARGGKLALLFPGEGSQYVNMMAELCIHFPEVRACFEAADRAVARPDRYPPSADIFPPPFFSDEEAQAAESRLWKIERATEAVLTADGAMYTLLGRLGVKPDMITGHSAGEWIAMAGAGVVDIDQFVASMNRLDEMYRKLAEDTSIPRMTMLAVGASHEEVLRLATQIDRAVHIANDNCPHQVVVVVGPKDAEPVVKHLRAQGVFVKQLPFDRGYHTPVFTYICEPLCKYFESLAIHKPLTTVYSCTTAKPYPTDPAKVVDLAAGAFARPLLFRETVEAMYAAGARVFVEAGPRGNLTAFTDDILRGRPHVAIATDHHRRSGITALNHAVGMLAALHVPLEFGCLYSPRSPRKLTLDPAVDRPVDEDSAPGTMQVSLCYPKLELAERPESCNTSPPASSASDTQQVEPVVPDTTEALSLLESEAADTAHTYADPQALPTEVRTAEDGSPPAPADAAMQEHFRMMERFLETQEEVMRAYLAARPHAEASDAPPESPPSEAASITSTSTVASEEKAEPPSRSLEDTLIAIVSEKTGYPSEMLNLDLDMEADLGIDSIKRIEILGALQETGGHTLPTGEIDLEQVAKLKSLRQVIEFLENLEGVSSPPGDDRSIPPPDAGALAFSGRVVSHTPGTEVVVVREIDPNGDLYLNDHCLDPRVSESNSQRDMLAVIPLTVSLEMMAEVAALLMPGRKVVGAKGIQAGKWIEVGKGGPKVELMISAYTGSSDRSGGTPYNEVRAAIHHRRSEDPEAAADAQPVVEGTIVFADSFPSAPPVELPDLKNRRPPANTAEQMYAQRRMFHGPRFQGVVSLDEVGEDGLIARLEVLPTDNLLRSKESPCFHVDPFLLDAAGQLVGYWPVEYFNEGFVLFPIRLHELTLYRENLKPGERAVCQMRIREVSQRQVRADMEIIAPDGRLWMRLRGWQDWRFYWAPNFYDFWRFPNKGSLSEPIELSLPNDCQDVVCRRMTPFEEMRTPIWERLWAHLILSHRELAGYRAMSDDAGRADWLFGRAVAKDAVRTWVKRHYGLDLYPADVEIDNDAHGAPVAGGQWVSRVGEAPRLTISHKGAVAVAAAGRRALGIDLERVEPRDAGFCAVAFNENERQLLGKLDGDNRDEWITRVWCAKEAAGKATGRGLSDGPRAMTVCTISTDTRRTGGSPDCLMVSCDGSSDARSPETYNQRFMVHSIRHGEFVIALAVPERSRDEGA